MRCKDAQRIVGQEIEEAGESIHDIALADHLKTCGQCARLRDELRLTWSVLGQAPQLDPSPDFVRKIERRLAKHESRRFKAFACWPLAGWQWMTLAASVVLLGFFLGLDIPREGEPFSAGGLSKDDKWDESFLLDLEQSLEQSGSDYLPTYDSWSGTSGSSLPDSFQSQPGDEKKGGTRHESPLPSIGLVPHAFGHESSLRSTELGGLAGG